MVQKGLILTGALGLGVLALANQGSGEKSQAFQGDDGGFRIFEFGQGGGGGGGFAEGGSGDFLGTDTTQTATGTTSSNLGLINDLLNKFAVDTRETQPVFTFTQNKQGLIGAFAEGTQGGFLVDQQGQAIGSTTRNLFFSPIVAPVSGSKQQRLQSTKKTAETQPVGGTGVISRITGAVVNTASTIKNLRVGAGGVSAKRITAKTSSGGGGSSRAPVQSLAPVQTLAPVQSKPVQVQTLAPRLFTPAPTPAPRRRSFFRRFFRR